MNKIRRFTREDYTEGHAVAYARRYDEGQRRVKIMKVSQQLTNIKGKLVLDLGCGIGFFSNYCSELGALVVAIDHADAMVSTTKQRYGLKFPIVQCAAGVLPFRNEAFDVIIALDVVEHFYELDKVLREVKRIIKPSGMLLITTPKIGASVGSLPRLIARKTFATLPIVMQGFIKKRVLFAIKNYSSPYSTHVKEYKPSELYQITENIGFYLQYMNSFPNRKSFGTWGQIVEFIFAGFLRRYKWNSAIYAFRRRE